MSTNEHASAGASAPVSVPFFVDNERAYDGTAAAVGSDGSGGGGGESELPTADTVQCDLEGIKQSVEKLRQQLAPLLRRVKRHRQQRRGRREREAAAAVTATEKEHEDEDEEQQQQHDPLETARTHVTIAYLVNALFFLYLRLQGVDPTTHPVRAEIGRVQSYFIKLRHAEQQVAEASSRENGGGGGGGGGSKRKSTSRSHGERASKGPRRR